MILKYKLSDGRIVPIDENDDNAIKLFQEKLKEKNLTAELITDEPGKSQGANQPQNNQQENTESSSENTLSDSRLPLVFNKPEEILKKESK